MSETEPSTPPSPVPTSTESPYFDAPAGELVRFLKLVMVKSGPKPLFPTVDLTYAKGTPHDSVISEHRDKAGTVSVKAEWFPQGLGVPAQFVIGSADQLLDYLDSGLFPGEGPVRFSQSPPSLGVSKIRVDNGTRSASVAAASPSAVLRPETKNNRSPYLRGGPDDAYISTDPEKVPKSHSEDPTTGPGLWTRWGEAGYALAHVPVSDIASLVRAGSKMVSHGYKTTEVVFQFIDGVLSVSLVDPKKPDGETVHFGRIDGATVVGGTNDRCPVLFENAEPFLSALSLLKASHVTVVHHPLETRMNLLAVEKDEKGTVLLRLTYSLMGQKDPRAKRTV